MLRTLKQHEVTTNQALTPLHGRPRAPAAALRHLAKVQLALVPHPPKGLPEDNHVGVVQTDAKHVAELLLESEKGLARKRVASAAADVASQQVAWQLLAWQLLASQLLASQLLASQLLASQLLASQLLASQLLASQLLASQLLASRRARRSS
ncbi:hypothetical protein EMIHUDRAFT_113720 [Emiliania huxleyi CCMP1516]|uniref:Uncharacterized protein n=2 Tax=Emiliania huxleyi TaxID=2903 RepID=A0A0D3K1G3_EMIH1|nr:hypothetical protein EMIHUDRAFT_113720 [Emiliania huxleyi CCMP1516]EOD29598.1 hypothetical protein EMIHUDRAFT_113720 [Emiliania huxleyi CCMP1516]|eukprot:XP_005782027.1 hypothetical protein EMIHUDRAFT_113720 [Emiliania huxleyi CCMP1516]